MAVDSGEVAMATVATVEEAMAMGARAKEEAVAVAAAREAEAFQEAEQRAGSTAAGA
jgi:hypothetical protein